MRRLLCAFLSLTLLLLTTAPARAADDPEPLTLTLAANLSDKTALSGFLFDGVFYITIQDMCDLIDGQIIEQGKKNVVIENRTGSRRFSVTVGSNELEEQLFSRTFSSELPSLKHDGQIYVSAMHFLKYLGASVLLRADAPAQLSVVVSYDIYDALDELRRTGCGYWFDLEEVYSNAFLMELSLVDAGVVSIIGRDSNPFRLMLNPGSVAQEAVEDALLTIVRQEGQGLPYHTSAGDVYGTVGDILGSGNFLFELLGIIYPEMGDVLDELEPLLDELDSFGDLAAQQSTTLNAFEGYLQFERAALSQRDLLRKSILRYSGEQPMEDTRYWNIIQKAAKTVDGSLQSGYTAWLEAAGDSMQNAAKEAFYKFLDELSNGNPVASAWDGLISAVKIVDAQHLSDLNATYNAFNCYLIEASANRMLDRTYTDWYFGDTYSDEPKKQRETLEMIQYLLLLQLKSTLSARDYFVQGGMLDPESAKEANGDIAGFLRRVECCRLTGPGLEGPYDSTADRAVFDQIAEQPPTTPAMREVDFNSLPDQNGFMARLENLCNTHDENAREYDCSDPSQHEYAVDWLINGRNGILVWNRYEQYDPPLVFEGSERPSDPLIAEQFYHSFGDGFGFYCYAIFDADSVDHALRTILNMEPSDEDGVLTTGIVRQDGNYYTSWGASGYIPPDIRVRSVQTDGVHYYVVFDWQEFYPWNDSQLTKTHYAQLRRNESERGAVWSIVRAGTTPFFETSERDDTSSQDTVNSPTESHGGRCGDGITWTLTDNELVLCGSGWTWDYDMNDSVMAPWYNDRNDIEHIRIEEGINCIGDEVFSGLLNLRSVTLPRSMLTIRSEAFANCIALTDVYFAGTEMEWEFLCTQISPVGNNWLLDADIHFESSGSA